MESFSPHTGHLPGALYFISFTILICYLITIYNYKLNMSITKLIILIKILIMLIIKLIIWIDIFINLMLKKNKLNLQANSLKLIYKISMVKLWNLIYNLYMKVIHNCSQSQTWILIWIKMNHNRGGFVIMKIDKGHEWNYWNLSYRRKFIRTLWMIPFLLLIITYVYYNVESIFIKTFLILILLIIMAIQLIYNFIMYQKEKNK